jgi:hypothetical protein
MFNNEVFGLLFVGNEIILNLDVVVIQAPSLEIVVVEKCVNPMM